MENQHVQEPSIIICVIYFLWAMVACMAIGMLNNQTQMLIYLCCSKTQDQIEFSRLLLRY